jgi:hypothetical protein
VSEERAIHEDFDYEPIPGLPEKLPEGEHILWSGVPDWKAFAMEVFHIRAIAFYAGLILVWRGLTTAYDGGGALDVLAALGVLTAVFGLGLGMIAVLAYVTAKATRYTITNKRVVMRIGVALTMTVNLPFRQILSADYKQAPLGTGAIALRLAESGGLGYLILWPHARPFHLSRPQPMLRGIKDGERVARILASALVAAHEGQPAPHIKVKTPAAAEPVAA